MAETDLAEEINNLFQKNEVTHFKKDIFAPFKQELRGYAVELQKIKQKHPDEAMGWLSSVSARIFEMILYTLDDDSRISTKFRVEALIPARDEIRFQFQIASRRVSTERLEWEISGGQYT